MALTLWIRRHLVTVVAAACSLTLPAAGHDEPADRIHELTHRIEREPPSAELHLQRGILQRHAGRWEAALADLERAAALDPGLRLRALIEAGGTALAAGRPAAALRLADEAIAAGGRQRPEALLIRARALHRLDRFGDAAEAYGAALPELPARQPEHYLEHARALAAGPAARLDEAIAVLDAGLDELGPATSLQVVAIDLERRRGCIDEALRRLDGLMGSTKRPERYLEQRGELLESHGRRREATDAYLHAMEAIARLPGHVRARPDTAAMTARIAAALARLEAARRARYGSTGE